MAETTGVLSVLLVEDDLDVAAGIGDYLEAHGVMVEFAHDGRQVRRLVQSHRFDLFILDVNLPGTDGIAICRELKTTMGLPQPALFLTARSDLSDKLRGFEAGAVDYMVKPFAPAELLARIRAIVAHFRSTGSAWLRVGNYFLDVHGGVLMCNQSRLQLLSTGHVIVRRLMEAHPGAVSVSELCSALWGDSMPDSNPLRAHIWQLRRQLLSSLGKKPIITVRGVGYRFACE